MFRSYISMIEGFSFLRRERQNLFNTRSVGNVADHFLIRAGTDLLFYLHAYGFQVKAQLLENVDSNTLAQFDQAEQKMFGADEVMVEAVRFFARQREHLLCARGKIVHGFIAHNSKCSHFSGLSNPPEVSGGLAIGRLTWRSLSRTISARSRSRSSAESFSECCFCRWAGWVKMNNSSAKARSTPGNRPTSTPNRIKESRFIVSFEDILWALAR